MANELHSGWVQKRSRTAMISNWRKRWLSLVPGLLSYFERPGASAKGTLAVDSGTRVDVDGREFTVHSGSDSLRCRCDNTSQASAWGSIIEREVARQAEGTMPPLAAAAAPAGPPPGARPAQGVTIVAGGSSSAGSSPATSPTRGGTINIVSSSGGSGGSSSSSRVVNVRQSATPFVFAHGGTASVSVTRR